MKDPQYWSNATVTTMALGSGRSGSAGFYSPQKSPVESCPTGSWLPKSLCLQGLSGQRACSVRLARSVREWAPQAQPSANGRQWLVEEYSLFLIPWWDNSWRSPGGPSPSCPWWGSQCILHGGVCLASSLPPCAPWDLSFRLGCWGHPN